MPETHGRIRWLLIVLTIATGSLDAAGFLRLGDVFTSVMTGNLELLGISAAHVDAGLAEHIGIAFAGYVVGAALGARLAEHADEPQNGRVWPWSVVLTFALEGVVLLAFGVGWELSGGQPAGDMQVVLLGLAALGMGGQSAAVRRIGGSGVSTTYMTGTLTQLIGELAGPKTDRRRRLDAWALARVLALIVGAGVSTLLLRSAPRLVPLVALIAIGLVVVLGGLAHRR